MELGKTHLPDAAKAQQAIDRWGAHQDAVRHKVDSERPEELRHDQAVTSGPISEDRDTPGKRKTDGPEYFSLDQAAREELLEFQG